MQAVVVIIINIFHTCARWNSNRETHTAHVVEHFSRIASQVSVYDMSKMNVRTLAYMQRATDVRSDAHTWLGKHQWYQLSVFSEYNFVNLCRHLMVP